jgi:chemotaxis protein CheD
MEKEVINVGIADYGICRVPNQIMTVGLGSCIGVVLYSLFDDVCGMAHIMLPSEPHSRAGIKQTKRPARYADTGLANLIQELENLGVRRENLKAKLCGGASMDAAHNASMSPPMGERNLSAVRETLKKQGIEIVSEDVGGNKSRTIVFDSSSKELSVRLTGNITYHI